MSNFTVALLVSLGASTWIYTKIMRRTGDNVKNSLVVAGVSAAAIFIFMLIILAALESWISNS